MVQLLLRDGRELRPLIIHIDVVKREAFPLPQGLPLRQKDLQGVLASNRLFSRWPLCGNDPACWARFFGKGVGFFSSILDGSLGPCPPLLACCFRAGLAERFRLPSNERSQLRLGRCLGAIKGSKADFPRDALAL